MQLQFLGIFVSVISKAGIVCEPTTTTGYCRYLKATCPMIGYQLFLFWGSKPSMISIDTFLLK